MKIQLKINGLTGEENIINLCEKQEEMSRITVQQLKNKIAEELNIEDDFRMVHKARPLEESAVLSSYRIGHLSTIHMLLKLPGGA
ncbi:hypothetical protein VZT92_017198 [Zoarces viviparus]|uniref:Ubiquitin-like domain-containing protein n=1 Tax=Zoarces viviparus TaxID=48416 RepID=A0AAW1ERC7_ZOAVI